MKKYNLISNNFPRSNKWKNSVLTSTFLLCLTLLYFGGMVSTPAPNAFAEKPFARDLADSPVLRNGDFELPSIAANSMKMFQFTRLPGWQTTADDQLIEIWASPFLGVSAAGGQQFLELNATQEASVFQDIETRDGDILDWQFFHRGRHGIDTLAFYIGAPGNETNQGQFSTGKSAWQKYSGSYTVPNGQSVTRILFKSLASAGGNPSVGNFIDEVRIDLQRQPVSDADGDGVADADDQCPDTPFGTPVDANGCEISTTNAQVCDILAGQTGLWFACFGPATGGSESWRIDSRSRNNYIKFDNGMAWARYTVAKGDKRIFLNLVFKNRKTWSDWTAGGRSFEPGPGDYTNWHYYEIDGNKSYRVQLWDNDTTRIRQFPTDFSKGVQDGVGATRAGSNGVRSWILMPDNGDFIFEYANCRPLNDTDGDGLFDAEDPDDDGDGIPDTIEGDGTIDFDQDGLADSFDLDSDNDGIPDNIEAQTSDDFTPPTLQDSDANGFDDAYGASGLSPVDSDHDGTADFRDIDSDGDGVNDLFESGLSQSSGSDADQDGLDAVIDANDNQFGPANGTITNPLANLLDSDGDAQNTGDVDYRDTDDDGDGAYSNAEGNDPNGDGNPADARDGDGDLLPDYLDVDNNIPDHDGDGVADDVDADDDGDGILDNTEGADDFDADGLANSLDLDSDDDGIPDNIEAQKTANYVAPSGVDSDGNGIDDVYGFSGLSPVNKDGDSDPDYLDFDCDNDGLYDNFESGLPVLTGVDADDDGLDDAVDADDHRFGPVNAGINRPASTLQDWDGDVNANGDADWRDYDDDGDKLGTFHESADHDTDGDPVDAHDSDGDGTPDYLDRDDDNDNIETRFEAPDANQNSRPDDAQDTDGDGTPDYLDLDDDGDGIVSALEGNDPDGNGRPGDAIDSDGDNIPDYLDPNSSADTDGDGIVDLVDKDDDGDGIPDLVEGDSDFDGDSVPNSLDLDSDNDGIPDIVEGQSTLSFKKPSGFDSDGDGIDNAFGQGISPINSDNRGNYDFLDIDADDDGPEDNFESGLPALTHNDDDRDGLDNAIDPDDTKFGPSDAGFSSPADDLQDTDGDARTTEDVDYRDWDDDGDHVRTDMEGVDPNFNGVPDDAIDSDGDGTPDYLDNDDDNDGILTLHEEPNPDEDPDFDPEDARDFDADGSPDYLDPDDDGDGLASIREGNDPNKNGKPDDAVDLDQNGAPDYLDPDDQHDTDGDGVADVTDIDDDNDGILDLTEQEIDLDGDQISNPYDLDSDGDGIPDNIEAQATNGYLKASGQDSDGDGLDDSYEPDGLVNLPDIDNDGYPDFIDKDSDQDGIPDALESGLANLKNQDWDGDGLDDAIDSDQSQFGPANAAINHPASVLRDADSDHTLDGDVDYRDNDRYAPGGISQSLALWLRSDTATSTTINNGLLSRWVDQSPSHHVAEAWGDRQPVYSTNPGDMINGYPSICFYGDGNFLTITGGLFAGADSIDELTVFVVNKTCGLSDAIQLAQYGAGNSRIEVAAPDLTPQRFSDFIVGTGHRTAGNLNKTARQKIENHPFLWSMCASAISSKRVIAVDGEEIFSDSQAGVFYPANSATFIGGSGQGAYFNGCIAEIIVYQRALTDEEKRKVENYLSIKYCIPIPFEANEYFSISGFGNMVAGLGRDDISGLNQQTGAHHSDILVQHSDDLPDKSFLFWGNDGSDLQTNDQVPETLQKRLNRIWRINESGDVGSISIAFDLGNVAAFGSRNEKNYAVLISASDNFSNARIHTAGASFDGSVIHFSDLNLMAGEYLTLGFGSAVVSTEEETEIPQEFKLEQNYPNPFNPRTQIQYTLGKAVQVKLIVFDILGREVIQLVNSKQQAGRHSITFDATKFASGLYFYQLRAGDKKFVRKMLFLK